MNRCPNCKREDDATLKFCRDCGTALMTDEEFGGATTKTLKLPAADTRRIAEIPDDEDTKQINQNDIPILPTSSAAGAASLEPDIHAKRDAYDIDIFRRSDAIFTEDQLDRGLSTLLTDHSYRDNFLFALCEFCDFFNKVQNHYININLVNLSLDYVATLRELENFLALNFFDYPETQTGENIKYCLYPYLNIDRGGGMKKEDMAEYDKHAEKLRVVVNKTSVAFGTYRRAVKEALFV